MYGTPILGPRLKAMEEWEQLARTLAQHAEQIVSIQGKMDTIYTVNAIAAIIAATAAGELVPDSTYTREEAQAVVEMLEIFSTWMVTPLPTSGITPTSIIFKR